MDDTMQAFRLELSGQIQTNAASITNLRKETQEAVVTLRKEIHAKDDYILNLQHQVLIQKREALEQGVHDRKRDLMLSEIPQDNDETPATLENKIRANFINKLSIPKTDVDKYIFTARHRLQKNAKSNKPPKVICVLVDLDHVNQVLDAARKKGKDGQHVQNHLPRALQQWKSHCLYQRRLLINNGCDVKDVRIRDRRGFTTLQMREGREFVDKLSYNVVVNDEPLGQVNFR